MCLRRVLGCLIAAQLVAALPYAYAADDDSPYYQRQATWQETLRASREALAVWESKQPEKAVGGGGGDAQLGPWYVWGPALCGKEGFNFKAGFETGKIDVGQPTAGKSWKLVAKHQDGKVNGLSADGNSKTYLFRTITVKTPQKLRVHLGSDDGLLVYLNGKNILSNNVARGPGANQDKADLDLRAGENQLLQVIYNRGGGHGYYFSTTEKSGAKPTSPHSLRRDDLWKLVERDFTSRDDARQIAWERRDGVWQSDWKAGELAELAGRYSKKIQPERLRDKAQPLAKAATNPRELQAVRALYYEGREIDETLAKLGDLKTAPLRLAIDDLTKSFPDKYRKGAAFLKELDALEKAYADAKATKDPEQAVAAGGKLLKLREEALLANPLLDFDRLLFVKRKVTHKNLGLPQNWQGNCALPRNGYDDEIDVLSPVRPEGRLTTLYKPEKASFVGDVDLHYDGDRMLFSGMDAKNRWAIYEIQADGSGQCQVSPAEHQDVDWYDACYLPDGRIILGGTACFHGVPCVGGGNTVANLYLLDPETKSLRQLCFDQDHDWCPTVLNNGRILYARWEYSDSPHYFTRLLFHMNPDGTNQMEYYGSNSPWPNSIFYARAVPGHPTMVAAVISGHHGVPRMGELLLFDPALGRQQADGAVQRIPGYGKKVLPVIGDGIVNGSWPKFLHPYPLSEKYFLTAMQPNAQSNWGIYLVDIFDNMLPIKEEAGYAYFEPTPFRKIPTPPVVPDRVNLARSDALINLSDIYSGPGLKGLPRGTVKKLRIYEIHYAYPRMGGHISVGIDGPWDVHRILGTVPVEADGSANFRVPANTPLAVQPLDENNRALQVMRSWFTAMPGEILSCVGCHESQNMTPPSKPTLAMQRAPGDIIPWHGAARGFSFKREVQPVLDKYCVGCHDDKEPNQPPNLTNDRKSTFKNFTPSYTELHRWVRRPGPESDYFVQSPLEWHASTSELVQMLEKGHHGVKLDTEAWDRLVTWIDLNVPDFGTWTEHRKIAGDFEQRRQELRAAYAQRPETVEEYPSPAPETAAFIKPVALKIQTPATSPKLDGWPFGAEEAKVRQTAAGAPAELKVDLGDGIALELALIPAGSFVMGAVDGAADEFPPHVVKIDRPFYLAKYEVTNAQYLPFAPAHRAGYISVYNKDQGNRGEAANRERQPAIRVSWKEAMTYCQWLTEKTGKRFSLPTEAQWEYACRAGTATPMNYGAVDADFGKLANFADERVLNLCRRDSPKWIPSVASVNDGAVVTEVVGKYVPNAWGLHDMHGNVWEWTRSAYRAYPDAEDSADDGSKVVRGGSFYDRPQRGSSSYRLNFPEWQRVFNVGFRVVCEAETNVVAKK